MNASFPGTLELYYIYCEGREQRKEKTYDEMKEEKKGGGNEWEEKIKK
jgi:hypothetical protein